MEDVLDLYEAPDDARRPVVCVDERPCQLIGETRVPRPVKPGRAARYDYEYERRGTANIFGIFEPQSAWRQMKVTAHRTKVDFAWLLKDLVDEHYPTADCIRVVLDNLNTHDLDVLYEVFSPSEAARLRRKLELHHTPKHASWLNQVEIEFSVLSKQCLDRRIGSMGELVEEVAAWEERRNAEGATVHWQFTTAKAQVKMARAYPSQSA